MHNIYIYMLPPPPKIYLIWLSSERIPLNLTPLVRRNPFIPQHCLKATYDIMYMQYAQTLMYVSVHMLHV